MGTRREDTNKTSSGKKQVHWKQTNLTFVCVCGKNGVEEDVRRAVMKH